MKLFTLDEANETLIDVRPIVTEISSIYSDISSASDRSIKAAQKAELGGGGMPGGSRYVQRILDLGERVQMLADIGVQIKDYYRGLIDFPSKHEGRIILLCWQLGEDSEIQWWHEIEDGFSGRKRI